MKCRPSVLFLASVGVRRRGGPTVPPPFDLNEEHQMCQSSHCIRRFLIDEGGPTAVEYAVMLVFVVCVLCATVASIGAATSAKFSAVRSAFTSAS